MLSSRTELHKRVLDSRDQVREHLVAQQKMRRAQLHEQGSPKELQDPVRVSNLELIQIILEALDNEHQCL